MPEYMLVNVHPPEECDLMEVGLTRLPEHLLGRYFMCTCPYGQHGFYLLVEGDTTEQVIERLPREWRKGTRALPVEGFPLEP